MIKMDVNRVAVARHGLILSQDGATASRMLSKGLRGLFYLIFGLQYQNWKTGPNNVEKKLYFSIMEWP